MYMLFIADVAPSRRVASLPLEQITLQSPTNIFEICSNDFLRLERVIREPGRWRMVAEPMFSSRQNHSGQNSEVQEMILAAMKRRLISALPPPTEWPPSSTGGRHGASPDKPGRHSLPIPPSPVPGSSP